MNAAFEFRKMVFLVEVLPGRATTLGELLTGITLAPADSIFYHLHERFFREPERLPEYPNDFAAWAAAALGDSVTAERLANLNLVRTADLAAMRREISVILAEQLRDAGDGRRAAPGSDFIFCRPRLVEFASGRRATTPAELIAILGEVDADSIGYHLFTPRATGRANDFSTWFAAQGHTSLAQQLAMFDPYLNSLEDNRAYLIELAEMGARAPRTPRA